VANKEYESICDDLWDRFMAALNQRSAAMNVCKHGVHVRSRIAP